MGARGQEPNAITKALATRKPCSWGRGRRDERWATAGEGLLSQFATRDLKFLDKHPEMIMRIYARPILRAIRRMFHLLHEQVQNPVEDFQSKLEWQKKRIIALAGDTACLSPIQGYVQKHYREVFNMAERFRKHGQAYFTFMTTPQIGPTNNAAEQALRFVVMDRRATQGTRSQKGRTFCERLWTAVGTSRMNNRSIFGYLCEAVTAWASGHPIPSLIPATENSS